MDWLASTMAGWSVLLTGLGLASRRAVAPFGAVFPTEEDPAPRRRVVTRVLSWLGRLTPAPWRDAAGLKARLQALGEPWPVELLLGAKLAAALAALLVGVPVSIAYPPAALGLAVVVAAAFRSPDFLLARLVVRRRSEIERRIPVLAELLVISLQAGLTPPQAFTRVAQVLEGSLGAEARTAVKHMELGVPWEGAIARLMERTGARGLGDLGTALTRSQRLGGSLAPSLRRVAEGLRHEEWTRAEDTARKAPVKMLFPLVFLILPAFLLLTVAPVLMATLRSLR